MAALAAASLATGVSLAAERVLYWMVDDTATVTVDGTDVNIQDYLTADYVGSHDQGTYYAARIHVTGGDNVDVFLPLYTPGAGTYDGSMGVEFWDNGAGWGAGVPTGNQSPLGIYAADTPEYAFTIEIGNVSWTEADGPSWIETVAVGTAPASYTALNDAKYVAENFDVNPPAGQIWTPTAFTAAPEPSSGLLALIGGALLALRRRRNGGD